MFYRILLVFLFILVLFFFKPEIDKKLYSYLLYLKKYREMRIEERE